MTTIQRVVRFPLTCDKCLAKLDGYGPKGYGNEVRAQMREDHRCPRPLNTVRSN